MDFLRNLIYGDGVDSNQPNQPEPNSPSAQETEQEQQQPRDADDMPRTYVPSRTKPYKKYDPEQMRAAVNEYESSRNKSLKEIGAKYNISKSVLHRHISRIMRSQGGQRALKQETEEYIIKYINICSEWGYPLDTYDLRILIKGYLDRVGIEVKKFKNNMPGPDFVQCFLKRHKHLISPRISQNIKRARAAVSPETIKNYFTNLETSLDGVPLSNIINYDETNLSDDPGKKKIITRRGVKYPERVMDHSKSSTSLMIAASADGTLLPPYVVYKAINIYPTWRQNGPRGCRYNRTKTGWFDGNAFENWVETIAMPYFHDKPGKKVMIGDNLSSHLSVDLIKKCKEKDIYFVFLPANSTHLTQPLDVAFFRPMKAAWREILFHWKKTEGRTQASVPKSSFPHLLKKLLQRLELNQKSNILAGFSKTGISPINKEKVLESLPGNSVRNETCTEEEKKAIDEEILKLLSEMRYGNGGTTKRTSHVKKKLNVQPGKSVGEDSDCAESDTSDTTSRINEQNSDDFNEEDIEGNIKANVIKQNKQNPTTSKKEDCGIKTKKKQTLKMGQGNEKHIMDKDNNKNTEEKSTTKQDKSNEIQLEKDVFDIQNMPIVYEDNFSFVVDTQSMDINSNSNVTSSLNDESQTTPTEQVNEDDQSEVKENSADEKLKKQEKDFENVENVKESVKYTNEKNHDSRTIRKRKEGACNLEAKKTENVIEDKEKQSVKGKGIGKKSKTREKDFEDIDASVKNTSEETYDSRVNKGGAFNKEMKRTDTFKDKQGVKGKGIGKKSKKQEKYKNTSEKNIYSIKEERILDAEAKKKETLIKDQEKIGNKISGTKRKTSVEVVKEKRSLGCQKSTLQEKLTLQKRNDYEYLDNMPIILADTMTVSENVTIECDNECNETLDDINEGQAEREFEPKKKKLQILSNEPFKHTCQINTSDNKKIPISTIIKISNKKEPKAGPSGIKRYYRNDAEILKDLMDFDD